MDPRAIRADELFLATRVSEVMTLEVLIAPKDKSCARASQFFLPEFSSRNFFQCTDFFSSNFCLDSESPRVPTAPPPTPSE